MGQSRGYAIYPAYPSFQPYYEPNYTPYYSPYYGTPYSPMYYPPYRYVPYFVPYWAPQHHDHAGPAAAKPQAGSRAGHWETRRTTRTWPGSQPL
jgi:hypothetical protein